MKDRHGTYYATKKVPKALQEAVARVLDKGKRRQVWLKRSLAKSASKNCTPNNNLGSM